MSFTKETVVQCAKNDLAKRLKIGEDEIKESGVSDKDFPDMSLGAAIKGEMSAQMISSGWKIMLDAKGKHYEYRADKYQLRLYDLNGRNYIVSS